MATAAGTAGLIPDRRKLDDYLGPGVDRGERGAGMVEMPQATTGP